MTLAYNFAFVFLILIVVSLNFKAYSLKEKPSFWVAIIFSFLGLAFGMLAKQDFKLWQNFHKRTENLFIVTGKDITRGYKGNNFNGYFGVITNNQSAYLPNHSYDNYKIRHITIGDTLKVWNFGNLKELVLQYSVTKDNDFLISSIIKNFIAFLICNSFWIWFFIKRDRQNQN